MYRKLKFLFCFMAPVLLVASPVVYAQETGDPAMIVDRVRFDRATDRATGEQWLAITLEVTVRANPDPEAENKQWVKNVGATIAIGYGDPARNQGRLNSAYDASVDIIAMEVNNRREITFYLPPEIMKRDRLRYGDPDFWVVTLSIDGQPIPPTRNSTSRSITEKSVLDGFTRAASEHLGRNAGILQPSFLTPFAFSTRNAPTYKRVAAPVR